MNCQLERECPEYIMDLNNVNGQYHICWCAGVLENLILSLHLEHVEHKFKNSQGSNLKAKLKPGMSFALVKHFVPYSFSK